MDIVKSAKKVGSDIEKGVEVVADKLADTFDNLASHLPFSNLAKKDDSSFHLEVDLPGVKKEDIEISIDDGVLRVSAMRAFKDARTSDDYYVCESAFGKYERRYVLPESVDTQNISAEFTNGRLAVELQISEKAKARKIDIK